MNTSKPGSGRQEPEFGQDGQNPDKKSRNPDAKSQNPDNYTHSKPFEIPFEDSIGNTLKNSGEAGPFHKHDDSFESIMGVDPFVAPIFCDPPKDLGYAFLAKRALAQGKITSSTQERVIMQSDAQTKAEFIQSLKNDFDDVVTLDDLPHEELAERYRHDIASGYDWKHVLDECERCGGLFDVTDAKARNRGRWLGILVQEFVKEQDAELLRSLVESHDPNFTLHSLADSFLDAYCLNKDRLERAGLSQAPLKMHGFYAGLELVVQAFQNAQNLVPSSTLQSGLDSEAVEIICHAILEEVAKTERGRHEALQDLALDRHADYRDEFVWGDDDDAFDSSVSPKRKAMIFMKYVAQLTSAGVAMTIAAVDTEGNILAVCVRRMKEIYSRREDVERVTALFEERPWISADRLKEAFRAYVVVFIRGRKRDESFRKVRFYCTKMVSVSWFLAHLDLIAKELIGDFGDRFLRLSSRG